MSKAKRRLKAKRRAADWEKRNVGPKTGPKCLNGCGGWGPHFVPPGLGSPGMFMCTPKLTCEFPCVHCRKAEAPHAGDCLLLLADQIQTVRDALTQNA